MKKALPFLVPVSFIVAAIVLYLPALHGQFLWDDEISIIKNDLLRRADGLAMIWTTIGTVPLEEHYWPVTYSFLWFEWRLWGGSAIGFHLVNMLLHGLVAIQIWRLMRRIGLPGAWLGTALFLVHPVNVESVAWVISIKGLLAALFSLLCIECYLLYADRARWKWLGLAVVCAAAAMLSKSSPVVLPVALGILIWYRRGRIEKRDWMALAIIAEIVVVLAFVDMWVVQQVIKDAAPVVIPPFIDRLAQSGWTFWLYVQKLIWPVNLGPFYSFPNVSAARPADWLPLVAIAAITAALWAVRRRIGRGPLACWLHYGIALGPILGIVYFSFLRLSPAADRYQYLAMIAPVAGIGAIVGGWIEQAAPRARMWRTMPAAAILLVLAAMSFMQSGIYRDQETFFRHAVKVAPDSVEAQYNLAVTLMRTKPDDAEKAFLEAIRIKPDHWPAVCNLGILRLSHNRFSDAAQVYQQALARGCDDSGVLNNYAWLLAAAPEPAVRNPELAMTLVNRLIEQSNGKDPEAFCILSAAQAATGQFEEAIETARRGRRIALAAGQHDQVRRLVEMTDLYVSRQPYVLPRTVNLLWE